MRVVAGSLLWLVCVAGAYPAQVVRQVTWSELQEAGALLAGHVEPDGWLRVESAGGEAGRIALVRIEEPGLTGIRYALSGSVRYRRVGRGSYLEMWSTFMDGSRYYTRGAGGSGLLQALEGDSGPRPFALPFFGSADGGPPKRLEMNVVLSGGGTVWLSPLRLVQYGLGEDLLRAPGAWWGERTAAWMGAIGGSLIGLLGAAIGLLASLGRCRGLVLGLVRVLSVVGLVGLAAGLAALWLGQPYAVYYPLLLGGGVLTAAIGVASISIRRWYREVELRRIRAMDLGSGGGETAL